MTYIAVAGPVGHGRNKRFPPEVTGKFDGKSTIVAFGALSPNLSLSLPFPSE